MRFGKCICFFIAGIKVLCSMKFCRSSGIAIPKFDQIYLSLAFSMYFLQNLRHFFLKISSFDKMPYFEIAETFWLICVAGEYFPRYKFVNCRVIFFFYKKLTHPYQFSFFWRKLIY